MDEEKRGMRRETDTVGMYSPGKAFVVYEMRRHVCRASRIACQ
jgi:hypothetical protein